MGSGRRGPRSPAARSCRAPSTRSLRWQAAVLGSDRVQERPLRDAGLERAVAARPERTADERPVEPRRSAGNRRNVPACAPRSGVAANSSRVYGCRGAWNRSSMRPLSTISPAYMTAARVAELSHDRQVVGDEDQREAEVPAEPVEELQYLRLHHHVERGRRLVRNQDLRVAGERHRDRRPLSHPSRQLVRKALRPARRDPDRLEQIGALSTSGGTRRASRAARSPRRSGSRSSARG